MKKVFIPSMDELYEMQDMGADVYKYILVKAIESLICYGNNYPNAGILKSAYKYLCEDPEIAKAICVLYPDEMLYSKIARNDIDLCIKLMEYKESKVCGLDYLAKFDEGTLTNTMILTKAILLLEKELANNPRYRFEYVGSELPFLKRGAGRLLDNIFDRKIDNNDIELMHRNTKDNVIKALINIEPSYAISLSINNMEGNSLELERDKRRCLQIGINNYANRYGIRQSVGIDYVGKDILTNPDQNVKRLIKTINEKNK